MTDVHIFIFYAVLAFGSGLFVLSLILKKDENLYSPMLSVIGGIILITFFSFTDNIILGYQAPVIANTTTTIVAPMITATTNTITDFTMLTRNAYNNTRGSTALPIPGPTTLNYVAEYVPSGSMLIGKSFNKVVIALSRTGTPYSVGTNPYELQFGVFDVNKVQKSLCYSFPVFTLTTTLAEYTFTCPAIYTIVAEDRLGVYYQGGSGSTHAVNVYGNATSIIESSNVRTQGATSAGAWTDISTIREMRMQLLLDGDTNIRTETVANTYDTSTNTQAIAYSYRNSTGFIVNSPDSTAIKQDIGFTDNGARLKSFFVIIGIAYTGVGMVLFFVNKKGASY